MVVGRDGGGNVYVTVGTTKFDKLVERVQKEDVLEILLKLGYKSVTIQKGNGKCDVQCGKVNGMFIECYAFKDSIIDDIASADLVISHAGAGSILETLGQSKPLVVVVNEDLMDNHQFELAEKMAEEEHLFYCTCSTLKETLKSKDLGTLKPLPPVDGSLFARYVDEMMGVT